MREHSHMQSTAAAARALSQQLVLFSASIEAGTFAGRQFFMRHP
jgi:hypothetical protein